MQQYDKFFQKFLQIEEKSVRHKTASANLEEVRKVNIFLCLLSILIDQLIHFVNMDFDEVESRNGEFLTDVSVCHELFVWI